MVKPFDASMSESRVKARVCGVRVRPIVANEVYEVRSLTTEGQRYLLTRTKAGYLCECKGYAYRGWCVHLGALCRNHERRGVPFRVASPSAIA